MAELFSNFAKTTLAAPATNKDLVLTVDDSRVFPAPGGGGFFRLVLTDASETQREVCLCTNRDAHNEQLTVQRGQEGTSAQAWPAGSKVEHRLTAGALAEVAGQAASGAAASAADPIVGAASVTSTAAGPGSAVLTAYFIRFTRASGTYFHVYVSGDRTVPPPQ